MKTNKLTILVASLGLLAGAACGGVDDGTTPDDPTPGGTSGNEETTFDHDNGDFNPFDLIDRLAEEGPPRFTARVHSCAKVRVRTLGNVLKSLGVNMADNTNLSAAQLYTSGFNALGGPNYVNRIRENINITTSSASREFDIFAAAAPQIIANINTLERCKVNGVGAELFDSNNNARVDGVTCLLGQPAQAAHLDFINITVHDPQVASIDAGKQIAVAALLAAAYTCE
jgi:hypothetical protein